MVPQKIISSQNRNKGILSPTRKIRNMFSAVLLLFLFFLLFAGRFLVIDEEPKKVDTIVVLSGGDGRLEKAIELYESGYASKLIVSNGLADGLWENAVRLLPNSSIILEGKAESTYDSAVYVKKLMNKYKFHSAILVSSDFHMRRVKYNFHRVYKGSDHELIYVANDTSYNPNVWWMNKRSFGITISEYVKIIGNTFGVHGNEAKRTLYRYFEMFFYE
ncbi:YdcF family protein [Neobacillus drentensis]|uniref:YdcF family protein n=1 Tax=Neobacillus drentensis TaxID=220684 RepID=UPI002FFDEA20